MMVRLLAVLRERVLDILLATLAILGVVLVLASRGRVTTGEASARSGNVLAAWRADDVNRIELERPRERVVLERTAADGGTNDWSITSPIRETADTYAADKLLSTLDHATWVRRIQSGSIDAKALGLDAPRLVVRVQMGGISYSLALGKPAPTPPGSAYLELTGDGAPNPGVMIVAKSFVHDVDVGLLDLRTRDLVPFDRQELAHIALSLDDRHIDISRSDWGDWLTATGQRVERSAVERLMVAFERASEDRTLDTARAAAVVDQASNRVGLELASQDHSKATIRLALGGQCPDDATLVVALRREPNPMGGCLPLSVLAALRAAADGMRGGSLFWLHSDEVEELEIELQGKRLVLERKGSGFVLRAPDKGDVELEPGNQRLEAIAGLAGTPADGNANAQDIGPVVGHVTLHAAAATEHDVKTETVELGPVQPDGTFGVRRKRDGAILRVPKALLRVLTPDATLLRSMKILSFSESELSGLSIRSDRMSERIERSAGGPLEMREPHGFASDASVIEDMVHALGSLSAQRWVADHDDGSFGLRHCRLDVHVRLTGDGGTRERTLCIGDPTNGGSFASVDGSDGVFVIAGQMIDDLDTLALDRSVFALVPEHTRRIELRAGDRALELSRSGDRFVEAHAGSPATTDIQTIIDALTSLRAQAALHTGPARPEEGLSKPLLTVRYVLDDGSQREWSLGSGDSWRAMSVHYARAAGVDATYVVPRAPVQAVIGAL